MSKGHEARAKRWKVSMVCTVVCERWYAPLPHPGMQLVREGLGLHAPTSGEKPKEREWALSVGRRSKKVEEASTSRVMTAVGAGSGDAAPRVHSVHVDLGTDQARLPRSHE